MSATIIRESDLARFWAKVDKTDTCWLWTAGTSWDGYGRIQINGALMYAHRLSYLMLVGPIPVGLQIDHLCRVRNCVRPDHLEAVTPRENILRSECPNAVNARKTHCKHGHEFTPENTYVRPDNGRRQCKVCAREATRRSAARKQVAA